jgi:hypothetical protein
LILAVVHQRALGTATAQQGKADQTDATRGIGCPARSLSEIDFGAPRINHVKTIEERKIHVSD